MGRVRLSAFWSNGSPQPLKLIFGLGQLLSTALVLMSSFHFGMTESLPEAAEFFPDINDDLTKITWAHGVNSHEKLTEAIEGSAMMLEADILMGTTINGSDTKIPIMAHPPNSTSDMTFDTFLDLILEVNSNDTRKGIKLDFKDIEAVEPVLKRLNREAQSDKLNFPVWLNADVLKGPVAATREPIDGPIFISLAKQYLPLATLSLGWTTRYGRDDIKIAEYKGESIQNLRTIRASRAGYQEHHVREMIQLLRDSSWEGPVTFAVRAGLITPRNSMDQLARLLTETMLECTFTIWSVEDDPVNMKALRNWIQYNQKGSVYLDLPFELDQGPVIVPDIDQGRPLGRSDHLLGNGNTGAQLTSALSFLITAILIVFASNTVCCS